MQESKNLKSEKTVAGDQKTASKDRQDDATSGETLSDLKETEGTSESGRSDSGKSSSTPSPDGQFDSERTGRDETGPM